MEDNKNTAEQQGKTFTQEELNAIIGKRLAEQKQQYEGDLTKREAELNRREMNIRAAEMLAEKGLPKDLAGVIRYETEEELTKAIELLETTRGFKEEDRNEYRVFEPIRLPSYNDGHAPDLVREAFMERG